MIKYLAGLLFLVAMPLAAEAQTPSPVLTYCGSVASPTVCSGSGGGGSTANQGTPNTAANAWPEYIVIGGTAVSTSNPFDDQLIQGGSVVGATNGLYVQPGTGSVFPISGTPGAAAGVDGYTIVPTSTTGYYGPLVQGVVRPPTNNNLTNGNSQPLGITGGGLAETGLFNATGAQIGATGVQVGFGNNANTAIATFCSYLTTTAEGVSSNLIAPQCNQYGGTFVDPESVKPTFVSSFTLTPPTGAGAVFAQYCGPTSGALRVRYISIQPLATTAGSDFISVLKTSTAASGGTGAAQTQTTMDTSNTITNTAVLTAYTVAPTAGTLVGAISAETLAAPVVANATPPLTFNFGPPSDTQSVVLRGAAQCVSLTNAITAGTVGVTYNITVGATVE